MRPWIPRKSCSRESLIKAGKFFSEENISVGLNGLKELKEIFSIYNIPFFLDYGTLLGCIREGGFINIDTDIDVGVLEENVNIWVVNEFTQRRKWRIRKIQTCSEVQAAKYLNGKCKIRNLACEYTEGEIGIAVDIYIYFKGKNNYKGKRINLATGCVYDSIGLSSTVTKKFYDITLPVPIHYEKYLDVLYNDWRTPLC